MDALQFIRDAIRFRHAGDEWIYVEELRLQAGFGDNEKLRIVDGFAVHLWPSKDFERIAYEFKVTLSDFMAELRDQTKRFPAQMLSNRFYFVIPETLYTDEIRSAWRSKAPECGLILVSVTGNTRVIADGCKRDAWPFPETAIAVLLKRVRDTERSEMKCT